MDQVVRKVGQHIEHEPEWEMGVTLQMRLINITGLVLRWCASVVGNDLIFITVDLG